MKFSLFKCNTCETIYAKIGDLSDTDFSIEAMEDNFCQHCTELSGHKYSHFIYNYDFKENPFNWDKLDPANCCAFAVNFSVIQKQIIENKQ
jgi:hypothetical protein